MAGGQKAGKGPRSKRTKLKNLYETITCPFDVPFCPCFIWYTERSLPQYLSVFLSEFISTVMFTSLACFSSMESMWDYFHIPHFQIALGQGLAYMLAIEIGGRISGAHVNPCITFAACILGKKAVFDLLFYVVIHTVGAIAGTSLAMVLTGEEKSRYLPDKGVHFCSSRIAPNFNYFQAFLSEFASTFILILVCCGIWDSRCRDRLDSISIKLGLTMVGLHTAFGDITGCFMNPSRALGAAFVGRDVSLDLLVFLVAPVLGTVVAAAGYRFFFSREYAIEMAKWRIEILPPFEDE